MATQSETMEQQSSSWQQAMTLEKALHAAIVMVGLIMRLTQLGRFPLLVSEANTALAVWRGVHGDLWRPALYSPLLWGADYVPFALLGGSDFSARLLTALAGAALVALPFFARDLIGRRGALFAAVVLAFSPTWLLASRTADGQTVSILALCVCIVSLWRHLRTSEPRVLRVAWVALALALVSSWNAYTPMLAVLLGMGAQWLRNRRRRLQEQSVDWPVLSLAKQCFSRETTVLFGAVVVLAASALGLNPSGIGATVSLAGHWVSALWPKLDVGNWATILVNLVKYDPLVLVLGLVGLGFAKERKPVDIALAWWAFVALVLGVLLGHSEGLWLLDVLLPMTLLAARGVEQTIKAINLRLKAWDWAMLWGALCLMALAFLQLAAYIQNGQSSAAWLVGLGLGLVVMSLAAYGFGMGGAAVARVSIWLVVALLASHSLRTSIALNYRTARQAHEALIGECTSSDLARLPDLVENTSLRLVRDKRAASVCYDASLDPLVGWYLRDMPNAQVSDFCDDYSGAHLLITEARSYEWYPEGYAAQRMAISMAWPDQDLTLGEKLRWLIYRDDVGRPETTYLQVWISLPRTSSQP